MTRAEAQAVVDAARVAMAQAYSTPLWPSAVRAKDAADAALHAIIQAENRPK